MTERDVLSIGATAPIGPLTVEQLWRGASGVEMDDALLEWAPDVVAFTAVVLRRADVFRFVVSPPLGESWPPPGDVRWDEAVHAAARQWCAAVDDPSETIPDLVLDSWKTLMRLRDASIDELGAGAPWELCQALLTLHAVADEACAGICASLRNLRGPGVAFRGRGRELLSRKGSIARLTVDRVSVLPKVRTATGGITHRSLSRYTCVETSGLRAVWHRAPIRQPGTDPGGQRANILLLPWPMRIRETDFQPVKGSVHRVDREPFGFFQYTPAETIDLDLVGRLLTAALDEAGHIDVVVLPEAAAEEHEIAALEGLLARRGVPLLIAGVREAPAAPDRFPGNTVHIGVFIAGHWWHYRQDKQHRWFLDGSQVEQYQLGGAFHPRIRWWEAMDVPRRSLSVIELGEGVTLSAVICEDLARLDGVAELLRSIGPTMVVTLLLDGPQLGSRWTARYAGVLADDPGSAVLTLTAYGMVQRSRPAGHSPSSVVAMWKDQSRGIRELALENGAEAMLVTAAVDRDTRYAADGRMPADDGAELLLVGAQPVRAAARSDDSPMVDHQPAAPFDLETIDFTVLVGWAEAVAEAVTVGRPCVEMVLEDLHADAPWRANLGISAPTEAGARALAALDRITHVAIESTDEISLDTVLAGLPRGGEPLERLARRVMRSALESLQTP